MGMTLFEAFQVALLFGVFIFGRYSRKVEHFDDLRSKMIFISVDDAEMAAQLRKNADRAEDMSLTRKERKTARANLEFAQEINAYRQLFMSHGWALPGPEVDAAPQPPARACDHDSQDDDDICTFPY